eukprot:jgi/Undpi1/2076/HiC_scaffold_12.g05462.m1
MEDAIAKCGVLRRKSSSLLRRKENRFFVLTNSGGLFYAKGFAAEFEPLKRCLLLLSNTQVSLERRGSGETETVIKLVNKGSKSPPVELEADAETQAWLRAFNDVVELLSVINGDKFAAKPRPLQGLSMGQEGWYLEPTGRMALYTLNSAAMWSVQDKREYDEATALHWIASGRTRRIGAGYPQQGAAAAAVASEQAEQGPGARDYPVNAGVADASLELPSASGYPVQPTTQVRASALMPAQGGGGGGAWVAPSTGLAPSSSMARSAAARVVKGGDGLGWDADSLVLRRPSEFEAGISSAERQRGAVSGGGGSSGGGGGGGVGGGGRGGGGDYGEAGAGGQRREHGGEVCLERRKASADGRLSMSPAMKVLQLSLLA